MLSDHSEKYSDMMERFYKAFAVTFELRFPFPLSINGESSCCSQCLVRVEGTLGGVGKSLGENSFSHGLWTVGGGHWRDVEPAVGCWPCWYRPNVQSTTLLEAWVTDHWTWSFSSDFLSSTLDSRLLLRGPSDLVRSGWRKLNKFFVLSCLGKHQIH